MDAEKRSSNQLRQQRDFLEEGEREARRQLELSEQRATELMREVTTLRQVWRLGWLLGY